VGGSMKLLIQQVLISFTVTVSTVNYMEDNFPKIVDIPVIIKIECLAVEVVV